MEMSASCTAPVHAGIKDAERSHPKFARYMQYRSAMTRQFVYCQPFASWVARDDEAEEGHETVYQVTSPKAALAPGWYKNKFAPRTERMTTFGPFATQTEAQTS